MTENPDFLSKQLITYLGNKRSLIVDINNKIEFVKQKLNKPKIKTADLFSGSGIIARLLKQHSSLIITNDLEEYSTIINKCFLTNKSDVDFQSLTKIVTSLNKQAKYFKSIGFIEKFYAPKNKKIKPGERVFYTKDNARRLDNYINLISKYSLDIQYLLLGPLLSKASIHVNTGGVFKGFYKNKQDIGQFGGEAKNALSRILGQISLELPILSNFNCDSIIYHDDICNTIKYIKDIDLAYLDPPYNQHPYGSNYFMLNLLVNYKQPQHISKVAGIPSNWNRSDFNKKNQALLRFKELIENLDAKFILVSFNNEGFISTKDMVNIFNTLKVKFTVTTIKYNTYRASKNLHNRKLYVYEYLFLIEK